MIFIAQNEAALAKKAAELVMETVADAVAKRGRATWALCGGNTPRAVFPLLAEPHYRNRIDWKKLIICWGDERCVPPTHADSNYKMAMDTFLSKVPVASSNLHRIPAEMESAQEAAKAYENELKILFKFDRPFPKFDLMWLGMGEDGHTASLFSGTEALQENEKWVVGHQVESLTSARVSITFPIINNARRVVVLAPGEKKSMVLRDLFRPEAARSRYPIQRVKPIDGELIWLLDKYSASKLPADELNKAKNI